MQLASPRCAATAATTRALSAELSLPSPFFLLVLLRARTCPVGVSRSRADTCARFYILRARERAPSPSQLFELAVCAMFRSAQDAIFDVNAPTLCLFVCLFFFPYILEC